MRCSNSGLETSVPVDPRGLADPDTRRIWVREQHMKVLSFRDRGDPFCTVDVFVEEPVEFEALWERAVAMDLGRVSVRVASIPDLISMKRLAGRAQDVTDIEALEAILEADG